MVVALCHFHLCYGIMALMKFKPIAEQKQGQGEQPLLRYALYARKSSEDVGSQAKSLQTKSKKF